MSLFIGIDISTKSFDLVVRKQNKTNPINLNALSSRLAGIRAALICLKSLNRH